MIASRERKSPEANNPLRRVGRCVREERKRAAAFFMIRYFIHTVFKIP